MKTLKKHEKGEGGVGFLGLLTVLFVGLKLAEVITWSWWLVFAPVWGLFVIAFLSAIIYGVIRGSYE